VRRGPDGQDPHREGPAAQGAPVSCLKVGVNTDEALQLVWSGDQASAGQAAAVLADQGVLGQRQVVAGHEGCGASTPNERLLSAPVMRCQAHPRAEPGDSSVTLSFLPPEPPGFSGRPQCLCPTPHILPNEVQRQALDFRLQTRPSGIPIDPVLVPGVPRCSLYSNAEYSVIMICRLHPVARPRMVPLWLSRPRIRRTNPIGASNGRDSDMPKGRLLSRPAARSTGAASPAVNPIRSQGGSSDPRAGALRPPDILKQQTDRLACPNERGARFRGRQVLLVDRATSIVTSSARAPMPEVPKNSTLSCGSYPMRGPSGFAAAQRRDPARWRGSDSTLNLDTERHPVGAGQAVGLRSSR